MLQCMWVSVDRSQWLLDRSAFTRLNLFDFPILWQIGNFAMLSQIWISKTQLELNCNAHSLFYGKISEWLRCRWVAKFTSTTCWFFCAQHFFVLFHFNLLLNLLTVVRIVIYFDLMKFLRRFPCLFRWNCWLSIFHTMNLRPFGYTIKLVMPVVCGRCK